MPSVPGEWLPTYAETTPEPAVRIVRVAWDCDLCLSRPAWCPPTTKRPDRLLCDSCHADLVFLGHDPDTYPIPDRRPHATVPIAWTEVETDEIDRGPKKSP